MHVKKSNFKQRQNGFYTWIEELINQILRSIFTPSRSIIGKKYSVRRLQYTKFVSSISILSILIWIRISLRQLVLLEFELVLLQFYVWRWFRIHAWNTMKWWSNIALILNNLLSTILAYNIILININYLFLINKPKNKKSIKK